MDAESTPRAREPSWRAERCDAPAGRDDRPVAKDRPERAEPDQARDHEPSDKPRVSLRGRLRRHPYLAAGGAIALVLLVVVGVLWWLNAQHYESTDDAFIDARSVTIASQLTGTIVEVAVTDNEEVRAGDVLVKIDPRDFWATVAQAQAQVDQAKASIANFDAQVAAQQARVDAAKKQVVQAEAALTFSREENARAQNLLSRGAGTAQQAQQTASDLRQKEAAYATAQANEIAAEKQIAVLQTQKQGAHAQLEQAQAQLTQAQNNLSRTEIVAPEPGRATKISAAVGGLAQPGQALMMFVPNNVWITANFKETQLARMRPGQPVDITIDAYPGRTFHGHVDSIQAGSGAAFSLLPPENATGNFVKVVQRVPVKIVFDGDPGVQLGPGMSVVPTVRVR